MKSLSSHSRNRFIEVCCFLFIVLFLYTAISKLMDLENFQLELQKSPLLSDYHKMVALVIPVSEILISLGLIWKKTRFISLLSFLFFMTLFTAYIYIILNFTGYIPCSCGGVIESLGWTEHLIFNGLFILLAIAAIIYYPIQKFQNIEQILLRNE
ncbi:hypothetical protein E0K83_12420 [Gramella sp. BOM4]|nr:hypothetical protein [Christiangramia bathymodioli]